MTSADPAATVARLVDLVAERNPMQRRYMEAALERLAPAERAELAAYAAHALDSGASLEDLAAAYLTIVADTLREQLHFRRTGRYRHATFAEVAASVYHDPEYMGRYMHGLALTAFFWPNHLELKRFFARVLPRDRAGSYLEIGPGHGFFLVGAMRDSAYERFTGVDLSAASIGLTRAIVASPRFGAPDKPCELKLADFLAMDPAEADGDGTGFDAVVAGEVLEHVEEPGRMLAKMAEMAKPGGFVFVTTCLNSPAVDHIFLYETPETLYAQVDAAGLRVAETLLAPHPGASVERCLAERLPVNIAVAMEKPTDRERPFGQERLSESAGGRP